MLLFIAETISHGAYFFTARDSPSFLDHVKMRKAIYPRNCGNNCVWGPGRVKVKPVSKYLYLYLPKALVK